MDSPKIHYQDLKAKVSKHLAKEYIEKKKKMNTIKQVKSFKQTNSLLFHLLIKKYNSYVLIRKNSFY